MFKRLRAEKWISVSDFLDFEHQTHQREWNEAHDLADRERALRDLDRYGLARKTSESRYLLNDTEITPDAVMRRLLESPHDLHMHQKTTSTVRGI